MNEIPFGVYPTSRLYQTLGRASVEKLLRERKARVLRRGWIQVGDRQEPAVEAVRRGGVLSCVSALDYHGVSVPEHHDVHVRGNRWAVSNRRGPFCRRFGRPESEYGAIDDVATALAHSVHCLDDEGIVMVCDSLVYLGMMSFDEIKHLFRSAPGRVRRLLDKIDGRAMSGQESMIRFRLLRENVKLDIQVKIAGVGTVDILIGRWLIVELDGFEFHGDRPHFTSDRIRITDAQNLGYHLLPFSYDQVVLDKDKTHERIMTAIRNGAHMRRSVLAGVVPEMTTEPAW